MGTLNVYDDLLALTGTTWQLYQFRFTRPLRARRGKVSLRGERAITMSDGVLFGNVSMSAESNSLLDGQRALHSAEQRLIRLGYELPSREILHGVRPLRSPGEACAELEILDRLGGASLLGTVEGAEPRRVRRRHVLRGFRLSTSDALARRALEQLRGAGLRGWSISALAASRGPFRNGQVGGVRCRAGVFVLAYEGALHVTLQVELDESPTVRTRRRVESGLAELGFREPWWHLEEAGGIAIFERCLRNAAMALAFGDEVFQAATGTVRRR